MQKTKSIFGIICLVFILLYAQNIFAWWHHDVLKTQVIGQGGSRSIAIGNNGTTHIVYVHNKRILHNYKERLVWRTEVIKAGVSVHGGVSVTLDSNDKLHIIFQSVDVVADDPTIERIIHYATNSSGSWTTEKFFDYKSEDYEYDFLFTKIALDSNDNPHISYMTYPRDLRYAYRDSTDWHTEIISDDNISGFSMVLDANDNPHVIYKEIVNVFTRKGNYKHGYKDSTGWHTEILNEEEDIQSLFSRAFDSNDILHILYEKADQLWYSYKDSEGWHNEIINEEVGYNPRMSLDSSGNPFIIYTLFPGDHPAFYFVHKDESGWHAEEFLDETGHCILQSMALDSDDNPHISYRCNKRNSLGEWPYFYTEYVLKYAKRDESSWHIEAVDSAHTFAIPWFQLFVNIFGNHISKGSSMAIDVDGNPHIVYLKNCFNYVTLLYLFSEPNEWAGITNWKYATRFDFVD